MGIEHQNEFKKDHTYLGKDAVERDEQESEDFINLNAMKFALPRILPSKVDREYSFTNFRIVPKEKFTKSPNNELFRRRLLQLWEFAKKSVLNHLKNRGKPLSRKKSQKENEKERKKKERRLKRKNKFRNYL